MDLFTAIGIENITELRKSIHHKLSQHKNSGWISTESIKLPKSENKQLQIIRKM
jgi:hypothetical protein